MQRADEGVGTGVTLHKALAAHRMGGYPHARRSCKHLKMSSGVSYG